MKTLSKNLFSLVNSLSKRTFYSHSRDITQIMKETARENNLSMKSSRLTNCIAVNDQNIYYEQVGKGKNIVLLMPGAIGTARTDFKQQCDHLQRDLCTVIAWDPPGYGKSTPRRTWPEHFFLRDAECANTLMKNLGHKKYNVLGWSDGGITAMILASIAQESVEKLIVWGANAFVTKEEVDLYDKISNIQHWSDKMRQPFIEEYGEEMFQVLWQEWVSAIQRYYYGDRQGDFCKERLANILCPTLIIHGQQDPLVPQFHPDYLHKHIANSTLVNWPKGKHNLHMRFWKEFNHLVENFIMEPLPKKEAKL